MLKEPYDIMPGDIYNSLIENCQIYSPDFFRMIEDTYRQFFYANQLDISDQWTLEKDDDMKREYERLETMKKERDHGYPYTEYFMPHTKVKGREQGKYPYDKVNYWFNNAIVLRQEHKIFFDFFFQLELLVIPIMILEQFLSHQLRRNFNSNISEYKKYLKNIIDDNRYSYYENYCKALIRTERYIKEDLNTDNKNINSNQNMRLSDIFHTEKQYINFMDLLVTNGYCQPTTYIWKDENKGNKGFLAAIIKYLHKQGYYNENIRPTNMQIQIICKNTFGMEIGIDTVNKANPEKSDLSFIPISPSIK